MNSPQRNALPHSQIKIIMYSIEAYVGNVRPALEFGMATWGNAAKSNLDRLTKVQT